MGYATLDDLSQFVPDAAVAGIPTWKLQQGLDDASAEADTHLRNQYTLPLVAPYDRTLVRHVCAIAVFTILSGRGFNPEAASNKTIGMNYDRALAWLKAVARREASLASNADSSPSVARGGPRVSSRTARGWTD